MPCLSKPKASGSRVKKGEGSVEPEVGESRPVLAWPCFSRGEESPNSGAESGWAGGMPKPFYVAPLTGHENHVSANELLRDRVTQNNMSRHKSR